MSSSAFERIAREFEANRTPVADLERFLSKRTVDVPIRIDSVADFVHAKPFLARTLLNALVKEDVLTEKECWVCPKCDVVIESKPDEYGKRECDLCSHSYSKEEATHERCYFLKRTIVRSLTTKAKSNLETSMNNNPLADTEKQRWAKIVPWKTLAEDDYTISFPTLNAGVRRNALQLIEKYGIVRLRWEANEPSLDRLLSLENWVGPARPEQNDFVGKVKALKPDYSAPPITGDSALALTSHVDGTQDEVTPAMLAFQYVYGGTWGGESTFLDTAAMLSELATDDLERILTTLARKDCATCTKTKVNKETGATWSKTFNGPLFRSECGGNSVSIRVREDDLLRVIPDCQPEFDFLKSSINEWARKNLIRYTPHEGDIVIFDNWRILHGRAAIGGRHQRIHDRMWIDNLLPEYQGKYLLGIRALGAALNDAVQRANGG
jgi:alpha-ketoglutarate-dependent taurine dioxygenase